MSIRSERSQAIAAATTLSCFVFMTLPCQSDPMLIDGKSVEDRDKQMILKGRVQQKVLTDISTKNFSLPNKPLGFDMNAQKDAFTPAKDLIPSVPKTDSLLSDSPKNGAAEKTANDKKTEQGSGSPTATEKPPVIPQKRVIVRIRRVVSLMEAEVAEGALKTAQNMLKKDPDSNVTIFLDLDAVSLADGEFNYFDQFSTGEDGNLRVISLKHLRSLLTQFGQSGGKIVVSEHWVKVRGFRNKTNTIVQGCELLNDEELAELLLSATNVIDY